MSALRLLRFRRLRSGAQGGFRPPGAFSFFSTEAAALPEGWHDTLYNRVAAVGDPRVPVTPILEQWISEGKSVEKYYLQGMVKRMRDFRRYSHGLEISWWMSDRRYFDLTPGDHSYRLTLISKVHGLEHAEIYFSNLPKQLKVYQLYAALLTCYEEDKAVEKAEAFFRTMKESNMLNTFLYNVLMKLYLEIGWHGKVDTLSQQMESEGFFLDCFSYGLLLKRYAHDSNEDGIKRVLNKMKQSRVAPTWHTYAVAAQGYFKAGLVDEASELMKESENLISQKKGRVAYGFLLTTYAENGNKHETYRIWNIYKTTDKVSNSMYMCMISALLKMDDVEGAEAIFKEWESVVVYYDFSVTNVLLSAYSKRDNLEKAEALVNKAIESGKEPFANAWDRLAGLYFQHDQRSKAVEAMKNALMKGKKEQIKQEQIKHKQTWNPNPANVDATLKFLEEQRDLEEAETFAKLLRHFGPLTREVNDC